MEEIIHAENSKPHNSQIDTTNMGGVERRFDISTKKVFDRFANFCNKLPFSGKLAITPITTMAIKEKSLYYKTVKTIEAGGLLGAMVLAHANQAGMGISRMSQNMELLKHNPSPEALLACSIDVAYTAANVAATYAQLHLSGRLAENFIKTNIKSVPRLSAWGINEGNVDYDIVAEKLMTAIVNKDQGDIDTFFMILSKEKKQKAMENIKAITEVIDETYSYDEIDKKIEQINKNVEGKSRLKYIFDIIKNAHKNYSLKSQYSFKQQMVMLVTTLGGQMGFLGLG